MAVFMLGGEDARDWISSEIVLTFLDQLLNGRHLKKLLMFYDFYFLPLLNPDGYEYSRTMVGIAISFLKLLRYSPIHTRIIRLGTGLEIINEINGSNN